MSSISPLVSVNITTTPSVLVCSTLNPQALPHSNIINVRTAFDLDDTLVSQTNVWMPCVWQYLTSTKLAITTNEPIHLLILSNQKKSHISDNKLRERIVTTIFNPTVVNTLLSQWPTGSSITVCCARNEDQYRKPNTGMIELVNTVFKLNPLMYVGDAAGRDGDHSDADRGFAMNAKITFELSDQFFFSRVLTSFQIEQAHTKPNTMYVLCGFPASGKSTLSQQIVADNKGDKTGQTKMIINRDTLKTSKKCLQATEEALKNPNTSMIIIDNTNPNPAARAPYLALAKQYHWTCEAIIMSTPLQICMHRNASRSEDKRVPKIVLYKYRKDFIQPSIEEGFDTVVYKDY